MFERRRLRVYVAGPISKGDVFDNIIRGIKVGRQLVHDGLSPYVPHFDAYMFSWGDSDGNNTGALTWNEYLEWDLEWSVLAEAVYRLSGASVGADLEVQHALERGIPVFFEEDDGYQKLLGYAVSRSLTGKQRGA